MDLINTMNSTYQMGLNEKEMIMFSNVGSFGVPRNRMKQGCLDLESSDRATYPSPGIPVDTADINTNELANWIHNARLSQFRMKQEGKVKDEYVIVLKADKDTPYPAVQSVINTLVDINVDKFNLITSWKAILIKKRRKARNRVSDHLKKQERDG